MPDYALCQQHECPVKNNCARYLGEPSKYMQSYVEPKFTEKGCSLFWDIKNKIPFKLKENGKLNDTKQ